MDGDCVFVLATGAVDADFFPLGAAAAEVVAMSVRCAVRSAEGLAGVPSVTDLAREVGTPRAGGGNPWIGKRRSS